ncbi:MAG: hypothetical protein J7L32_00850, partial [Thermoplasmata archaeon]|nr:hypothetical protein [Thermoplasmata archaeon]
MNENMRSKTLAMFVVLAMLLSTLAVIMPAVATIGIDEWEGDTSADNDFVNTSTSELYYGNTVTIQFNKTELNDFGSSNYYLYYPVYKRVSGVTGYEYNVTWTKWGELTTAGKAENVDLNITGLWFVSDQFSIDKTNLTAMQVHNAVNGWQDIVGWFWVNSTKYYTVTVSPSTIHYDKNESVTITVKHGDQEVGGAWCDIRYNGTNGTLIRHELMDSGTWTFNPYDYTHSYGAGVYSIIVYKDVDSPILTYGAEGGSTGYNNTFGNTSIWTDMHIRNSTGVTGTTNEATYYWDNCGPFDPPEYTADMVNLTVVAGTPTLSIPEANATMYWSFDGEVNVSIKDYDGNNISTPYNVVVLNKDKEDVTANITTIDRENGYCRIYSDSWGKDSHDTVWGTNGTWYVRIVKNNEGNASEEWNGTVKFKVTKAPGVQIKLIDDGDGNNDGEISEVPAIGDQPLTLQFQVINREHDYLGDASEANARKNITLSGNALLLSSKTLDEYNTAIPGSVDYVGNTWCVNFTPTMALNGGEITISVDWGDWGSDEQTITIGGSELNGTIVSISPEEFVIGENVTLTVTVTGPTGYPYPNAYVALYFINDSGGLEAKINETNGGGTTSGEYTFFFNVSQQTDNQSQVTGWGSDPKAPRY